MARISDSKLNEMVQKMSEETGLPFEVYNAYGYVRLNLRLPSGGSKIFSEDYKSNSGLAEWINAFMMGWQARDEFIRKGTLHWRP